MNNNLLHRLRIVLVEPTHPGNIGAAARAMKAMGLDQLCLVAPARFPSAEATARAAGADDLLHDALLVESVDEALAGCGLVLGTTARARRIEWPVMDVREAARRAVAQAAQAPVAVLFGRERSGLTNAEIDRCQALIRIPASSRFQLSQRGRCSADRGLRDAARSVRRKRGRGRARGAGCDRG